jgi:hypothetical protein
VPSGGEVACQWQATAAPPPDGRCGLARARGRLFHDRRVTKPARDNNVAMSTADANRDEVIAMLAARKPSPPPVGAEPVALLAL